MHNDKTLYYNYLEHHGILGQRWGKKNGPPYPLGASDHSAREKKAGWRKSLNKDTSEDTKEKKKFHLSDKQKKYLKIGAAITATALVTAGTVYLAKKTGAYDKGKDYVKSLIGKKDSDIGYGSVPKEFDEMFPKKISNPDVTQDFKGINPNRTNNNVGFTLSAHDGLPISDNNCQACGLAYEIKRRTGRDVQAALIDTRDYKFGEFIDKVYKNGSKNIKHTGVNKWSDLEKELNALGPGARGTLGLNFTNKDGGHVISFEVLENGRTVLMDTQIEQAFGFDDRIFDLIYKADKKGIQYVRTDTLDFNDAKTISEFVLSK